MSGHSDSPPLNFGMYRKEELVAFLRSSREDKQDVWNNWFDTGDWQPLDISGTFLFEADLTGLILISVNLQQADLWDAKLIGANLENANLSGAQVFGASFAGADLRSAQLSGIALATLADGGLRGVRLHQAYLRDALSLLHNQFLDEHGRSTIFEEVEGHFGEAKDVYKSLKGYFEGVGDYEGANWAYRCEQQMEQLLYCPIWARRFYSEWRNKWVEEVQVGGEIIRVIDHGTPKFWTWLGHEIADKLAGYGLSLIKPLIWLAAVILGFALIYYLGGMITDIPGCEYPNPRAAACRPGDFLDALVFSVSAMTTVDSGTVQPYLSNVSLAASVEALLGIALTGLFGFVLGNRLRNS